MVDYTWTASELHDLVKYLPEGAILHALVAAAKEVCNG